MSRVRRGFKARQRRNKIFKLAKGFQFDRRTTYRQTVQTVLRALHNAYKTRRLFKRDMRRLWISRINAGARLNGTTYSRLMASFKTSQVGLNRKMLAQIAATDAQAFSSLVKAVQ